jgi:hypothetical protein
MHPLPALIGWTLMIVTVTVNHFTVDRHTKAVGMSVCRPA